jgi:tyrosinase
MKKILIPICILIVQSVSVTESLAQRIRTDHREMTPGQKTAYLNAVNEMRQDILEMATFHATNFNTPIHSTSSGTANGKQFLSWHRVHQLDMEEMLRGAGTVNAEYITIPYWDWRTERTVAGITWDDAGFLALSGLHPDLQLSRSLSTTITLATTTDINNLIAMTGSLYSATTPTPDNSDATNASFFSKRLEGWHNLGHGYVGGTMNTTNSPRDPVFFLHHGFVDKLWQDWEERDNVIQSVFDYTSLLGSYSPINPNSIIDSRYAKYPITSTNILEVDVWYAFNKKLLLDGLAGDFNVTGLGKIYSYTPFNGTTSTVEGTIFAGDIRRDASDNVIADTKGGFVVKNGADCVFKSGKEIRLMTGFKAEAGSSFLAQIVTAPHGHSSTSGRLASAAVAPTVEEAGKNELERGVRLFPNPVQRELNVEFSLAEESMVAISIYNDLGQLVYSKVESSPLTAGTYQEKIHFDNYPKGIYFINMKWKNSSKTFKLVK